MGTHQATDGTAYPCHAHYWERSQYPSHASCDVGTGFTGLRQPLMCALLFPDERLGVANGSGQWISDR